MADRWYILSTDGACRGELGQAGYDGGVLRNQEKVWVAEFAARVGRCSAEEAEVWGIRRGLELAWELGVRKIQVESDAEEVVKKTERQRRYKFLQMWTLGKYL